MNTLGVDALTAALEAVTARIPGRDLARAAEALSARYRPPPRAPERSRAEPERPRDEADPRRAGGAARPSPSPADVRPVGGSARLDVGAASIHAGDADRPLTDAERAAYLAVRAPATFAAVSAVFDELTDRCPDLDVRSVLDLGAGPGVGVWAALERFPRASRITLVERDRGFAAIGREILDTSGLAAGRTIDWRTIDVMSIRHALPASDLVLLSYALGELPAADRARLIDAAWSATRGALVIVEPGTPTHFAAVLEARTELLTRGVTIAAPCPHAAACPMAAAGDWCHFSVRLPRSKQHRRLKAGSLSYEDEKFSYLVVSRASTQPAASRIVRHPRFEKGRVMLTRCTAEGLVADTTIGRTLRESYRQARKARWGDAWPPSPIAEADEGASDDIDVIAHADRDEEA